MGCIFYNGNIHTMDGTLPLASAVAVKNGIIIRVGNDNEILALKTDETELVDLNQKTMVPGFSDSHMHLLSYGYSLEKANLYPARSMDDLVSIGKDFLSSHHHLRWLQGRGWNTDDWEDRRFPTRYDLDRISTDIPVSYTRACGHIICVNSKALEIMGVSRKTEQISGGTIGKDNNGEPTGLFAEAARDLVYDALPELTVKDIKRMLEAGAKDALSYGLTLLHSDDFEAIAQGEYDKVLQAYNQMEKEGSLPIRVFEQCLLASENLLERFISEGHCVKRSRKKQQIFRIGSLKELIDGSLGGRTALLDRPYANDKDNCGIATMSQDKLNRLVLTAHQAGMPSSMHCIGNGAMKMALDAIENAMISCPMPDVRHALIHCQITDTKLLERCRQLGVSAYVQPAFIDSDMYIVRDYAGEELEKTSYAWKTMMDMGINVAFGSDSPVISLNVMEGIYCAVTRKDLEGNPKHGWLSDQKMTVEEAVRAYTVNGAYGAYDEAIKGMVKTGQYADFAVLERDIFTIPEDEIKDVKVDMTVINGKVVYKRQGI